MIKPSRPMRNTEMHKQNDFLILINDPENLAMGEWLKFTKRRQKYLLSGIEMSNMTLNWIFSLILMAIIKV